MIHSPMIPPGPSANDDELVTVVIPAYNAASTIDETLLSVRAQTHANLDIIVVDDGSTDQTAEIAARHAAVDHRIRIVRQPNAGVAAARNHGWRLGLANLISFLDADDLWSADKTERQLAALREMPEAGLVYSGYVIIDADSRITYQWEQTYWQGDVLSRLLLENFIGNGSSALVRRQALEDVGGFEPGLQAAGAGGCEDILFYTRVAERYPLAAAPGALIGYRFTQGNMSSDLPRMLRSWMMVQSEFASRHSDKRDDIDRGFERFARWLVRRAVELRQHRQLPRLYAVIARRSRRLAVAIFAAELPKALRDFGWSRRVGYWEGPRFATGAPSLSSSELEAEQIGEALQRQIAPHLNTG